MITPDLYKLSYWNGPTNLLQYVLLYCLNSFSSVSVTHTGDGELMSSGQFWEQQLSLHNEGKPAFLMLPYPWWYHSEHICSLCPQTACRPLKTVTRSLSFPTRSSPSTSLSGMVLVSFPPAWPLWDPSSLTINLRAVILKLNGEIHYKKYILYHDPVYI